MILEPLLGTNKAAIMKRDNEFSFSQGLEGGEGMHNPVVGVDDVRALLRDNAAQCPQHLWIGEWRQVQTFFVGENGGYTLHRAADAVDAYTLTDLEFWQPFFPECRDRDIMSARGKRDAEIMYMVFFPTNDGWVELREH